MFTPYKHTQTGYVILFSMAIGCLIIGTVMLSAESNFILVLVFFIVLIAALLFSSLTIEIKDNALLWRFGIGLIRKRVSVAEIEHVEPVRNSWLYGWGIRITPYGWLYNVSGLDAVQIRLKSGKTFRLGTDEPQRLYQAIMDARQMQ